MNNKRLKKLRILEFIFSTFLCFEKDVCLDGVGVNIHTHINLKKVNTDCIEVSSNMFQDCISIIKRSE